jgi:hypothetical protein
MPAAGGEADHQSASTYISSCIRQHTSAYVSIRPRMRMLAAGGEVDHQSASTYISSCIRQRMRQHTSPILVHAYVSMRQHTSAYAYASTLASGEPATGFNISESI